jgi:hypothetical protein
VRVCLRTIALVYLLEASYLVLLAVDHRQDVREFRKVVRYMVQEYRR